MGDESEEYLISKGIKVGTHYGIDLHLPTHKPLDDDDRDSNSMLSFSKTLSLGSSF